VGKGTLEQAAGTSGSLQIAQQVFPFFTILGQKFLEKIPVAIIFSRKFRQIIALFSRCIIVAFRMEIVAFKMNLHLQSPKI
jgi:hypothetical protein